MWEDSGLKAGAKKKGVHSGKPPPKPFSYKQDGEKNNNGNGPTWGEPGAGPPQPAKVNRALSTRKSLIFCS